MAINIRPGMTRADVDRKIEHCARKRDHSCDVIGKVLLGLTYQQEIDEWLAFKDTLPPDDSTLGKSVEEPK
jgi:hypothetical protein